MNTRFFRHLVLVLLALRCGEAQEKPASSSTWQDEAASRIEPYRQLKVEDFPIDDTAYPEFAFYLKPRTEYFYDFLLKPNQNGFTYAYIQKWTVFSGLDKKATSRKSKFKSMKAELPYAQALLDINEIHARRIAALKPGELPSARATSFEEAKTMLDARLKEFLAVEFSASKAEMEAFSKATGNGQNKKKVRELASAIQKRLEAIPPALVLPQLPAASGVSPAPISSPGVGESPTPGPASPSPTPHGQA